MANLNNLIEVVQLNNTADITHADVKSEYVDLAGYNGCILVACVGTMTGADASNYVVPTVQESDTTNDADFSAATDVVASPAFSKVASASEDNVTQVSVYTGSKRYVRILWDVTSAGSYPTGPVVGLAILSKALREPPAAPTTGTAA